MNAPIKIPESALQEARDRIFQAVEAEKCWRCGCLHDSVAAIERALSGGPLRDGLDLALRSARERFVEKQYDCIGCDPCYPAVAVNRLNETSNGLIDVSACPAGEVTPRDGWPPFPGDYTVLRSQAPVAVCTLSDTTLFETIVERSGPDVAMVGMLRTENLGIERILGNILANPRIRFLILSGVDSQQEVGHFPGQSMLALARSGLDERARIVGASGKRPVLKNVSLEAVEHFRATVDVIDFVGRNDPDEILDAVRRCASRDPGPAESFSSNVVAQEAGFLPERVKPDPAGYFVVYVDPRRRCLTLEHYRCDGILDAIFTAESAAELYTPVVERRLVTRLDHAAYLGRELSRAEEALQRGEKYVQDAAPERLPFGESKQNTCGCGPGCAGEDP